MTLSTVLFRSGRSIGGIIPNVVLREQHSDSLTITDHPVELGASISDHAYRNPAELTMEIGWSNGSLLLGGVIDGLIGGSLFGAIKSVRDMYEALLALQKSRTPLDVSTGKRNYQNMLIRSVGVTTDATTENALIASVQLREVLIVSTQATTLKGDSQAMPAMTAPTAARGATSLRLGQNIPGWSLK